MPKQRNIGLDVLRALAIVSVVLFHCLHLQVGRYNLVSQFGCGVELFFVLSGFLIGRIYFQSTKRGTFTFWNFWRSRWWRTLPPYVATLIFYLAVRALYPVMPPLHWYYALFLQNYAGIPHTRFGDAFGPSWSLCVEEHFYLLLPIAGYLVDRCIGRKAFAWLLPVVFVLPGCCRFILWLRGGQLPSQWFWYSHMHAEGLIAGVWLAYIFVEHPEGWMKIKKPALALLWLAPITILWLSVDLNGATLPLMLLPNVLYAIGFAAWLRMLYDMNSDASSFVGLGLRKLATGIALCSYSIYLTHTIVDPWVRNGVFGSVHRGAGKSILVIGCTMAIGVLFYFAIERPSIITRDRYLKHQKVKEKAVASA